MKTFIATLTALLLTGFAHAGNYSTCLNGIYITAYGISAPNLLRQCFPGRYSQQQIETALADDYQKVAEQQHTALLRGDGHWLILVKSVDGRYVSEIAMIGDKGI